MTVSPDITSTWDFKQNSLVFNKDIDYSGINVNNIICPPIEIVAAELTSDDSITTRTDNNSPSSSNQQHKSEAAHPMSNFSNNFNSFQNEQIHQVNTMKFTKPTVDTPNIFKSEKSTDILSGLKHICAVADGY